MDPDVATLLHDLDEGKARRLLEGLGQRAALREFERQCAVRHAVDLLQQRVERSHIRDRLMQRYGLERWSAYRRIDEALQIFCRPVAQVSQDDAPNATPRPQDQGSNIAKDADDV
jgi:hypothetical protein